MRCDSQHVDGVEIRPGKHGWQGARKEPALQLVPRRAQPWEEDFSGILRGVCWSMLHPEIGPPGCLDSAIPRARLLHVSALRAETLVISRLCLLRESQEAFSANSLPAPQDPLA